MQTYQLGRGFSLIEVMLVLSITGVLATLAVPSMMTLRHRVELRGSAAALEHNLSWARSEAIKRNHDLIVCPRAASGCAETTDWSAGWIGFVDVNRDRRRQAAEPIVLQGSLRAQLSLAASSGRMQVRFTPNGMAMGSNLSLTLCHRNPNIHGATVLVAISGRIRRQDAPVGAC